MTIAIVQHLEKDMATAFEAGDDRVFTAARNKRENVWRYRDSAEGYTLERVKYALTKVSQVPRGQKAESPCPACANWDGDVTGKD